MRREDNLLAKLPGIKAAAQHQFNNANNTNNSFNGSGNSTQNNSLKGQITVTVAQVYPNGNFGGFKASWGFGSSVANYLITE